MKTPTLRAILAVLAAGLWINASEFFRNEVLVKHLWTAHFQALAPPFPDAPANGMAWMAWGFLAAGAVFWLSRRFGLIQAALLAWLLAFVLMWIVIWNLGVLPAGLLVFAAPLSLLEMLLAAWMCRTIAPCATG